GQPAYPVGERLGFRCLRVLPAAVPAADDLGHGVDEVLLPRALVHRLIISVNAENLDVHRLAVFLNVNYLNAHETCREGGRGDGRHRGWRRPGRADDRRAAGRGRGPGRGLRAWQ